MSEHSTRNIIAPFFSVIVPCYNVEKTIQRTLNSIYRQTFRLFEIIVIDDGSSDSTYKILKDNSKRQKIRIIKQDNKGLGGARNSGIRVSKGKYIAFIDADDLWVPEKLSVVYDLIISHKENVDIFCHDEYLLSDDKLHGIIKAGPYVDYIDLLMFGNCLSPSATVIRKDVFDIVGGFVEDRASHGVEDYDLWLRCAAVKCKIYYIHHLLGAYYSHENNMTLESTFSDRESHVKEHHFRLISNDIEEKKSIMICDIDNMRRFLTRYRFTRKPYFIAKLIFIGLKNISNMNFIIYIYHILYSKIYSVAFRAVLSRQEVIRRLGE